MNYRHSYHAGNFADVLKHVVMIILLRALAKKEAPFCFLDTHAGIGLYSLESIQAQKSREYESGITNLMSASTENMPDIIREYIAIVKNINSEKLQYYPGSPLIAKKCLRDQDQFILCELHPEDALTLKNNLPRSKNIAIHHMDGYLGMKAFLPPKLKRGLVMIDPPFEVTNEFELITQAIKRALMHWQSGHFMIWYPIKNRRAVDAFYKHCHDFEKPYLTIEFTLNQPIATEKLSACGIMLINPPWQVEETLKTILLPYIAAALNASWTLDKLI